MEILIMIAGLVILDVAALLWGADSRDGFAAQEWRRRKVWRGFGA